MQEEIVHQKQALRNQLQSKLNTYSVETLKKWSQSIQEKVLASDLFAHSKRIALYSSHLKEVETQILFKEALKEGKEVAYPKAEESQDVLSFFWIKEEGQLRPSKWGIPEPDEKWGARAASVDDIELLVVPGLAFDRKGYRLGRGKAFYDRTLKGFLGQRLGLAYSFQVLDELPHEAWDQRMHGLVSEREWIRISEDF